MCIRDRDPATDYVAEFTKHIPRAKVLSARAVMTPGAPQGATAGEVAASDRIETIADKVEASDRPFAVVDETGAAIGSLDRRSIVDLLVGRWKAGP